LRSVRNYIPAFVPVVGAAVYEQIRKAIHTPTPPPQPAAAGSSGTNAGSEEEQNRKKQKPVAAGVSGGGGAAKRELQVRRRLRSFRVLLRLGRWCSRIMFGDERDESEGDRVMERRKLDQGPFQRIEAVHPLARGDRGELGAGLVVAVEQVTAPGQEIRPAGEVEAAAGRASDRGSEEHLPDGVEGVHLLLAL
jgi:hypothetical protein